MELTGRTQHSNQLVCRLRKVTKLRKIGGCNHKVVSTDEGEMRLSPEIELTDLTVGQTYFFQTITLPGLLRPIQIIDYVKF